MYDRLLLPKIHLSPSDHSISSDEKLRHMSHGFLSTYMRIFVVSREVTRDQPPLA